MRQMVQVINGEITQYFLPKVGTLKDGSQVSGYHLLDLEILLDEGWLPLVGTVPSYDLETQYLIDDGYEILEDKVIKKYIVEDIPAQEPSEIEKLQEENEKMKATLKSLERFTLDSSTTQQELIEILTQMEVI